MWEPLLRGLRELAAKQPADINPKEDFAALRGVVSSCQRLGAGPGPGPGPELAAELLRLLGLAALPLEAHMLAGTALGLCLPAAELLPLLDQPDPRQRLCLCHGLVCAPSPALREDALLRPVLRTLHAECVRLSRTTPLAFRVLAGWLQRLRELGLPLPARAAEELVVLVSASWEVPLSGVRESCSRSLAALLDLADAGLLVGDLEGPARWLPRSAELLQAVLEQHPWTSKSKYFLLCVLLPRVPRAGAAVPAGLPEGLLLGAASHHLVSAASDVYATILRTSTLDAWRKAFLQPVVDILASETNRLLVQNVLNHWIQPTVKAFPESLGELLSELRARPAAPLLALTFLLRLARREGLWDQDGTDSWQWQAITRGLHHADQGVRAYAFAAVCDSGRAFQPISEGEAEAVRLFLEDNVSVDSAALRHSVLGSLSWLLLRARNSGDAGAGRLLAWLHGFLLRCLEPGSNYQRKITALGAYLLVVRLFQEGPGAQGPRARKAVRTSALSDAVREHFHFASEDSRHMLLLCIADPTDDIRETAADILMECGALRPDSELLTELASRAIGLCRSQLFFEAESGALLARIVSFWTGGRCDELRADALLQECEVQLAALRRDVLLAASSGSPLHGALLALRRVGPDCDSRLLALLEGATEHCLGLLASTSSSEFAPSFAEMGEAIDNLVASSPDTEGEDVLTLTPAHQLVLNCIWLNLKTCCGAASDLAARLARGGGGGAGGAELAERCALIPVAVLTRCRHKGAIEAAGLALQQLVRALTLPPLRPELSSIPQRLLRDFLRLLLEGRTASGTSVSRRSAGLGILVHRIVVGDQQPHKPLLQECVSQLLAVLAAPGPGPSPEQHDSAEAQALHFLRMLVADAGLRVHMVPHLSHIALLCFQHLTSSVWAIRNASLQLFGAIVPKLVGQRKTYEAAIAGDTAAAVEELALRYPELLAMLLSRLESAPRPGDILQEHSQLIPLLSLLARASAPSTILANAELRETLARFKAAFLSVFDSPIALVRTLAAKAYVRFTPVCESTAIFRELCIHVQHKGENGQVGCLIAMDELKKQILVDGLCLPSSEKQAQLMKLSIVELEPFFDWQHCPSIKHSLFLKLNRLSHMKNWKSLLGWIDAVLSQAPSMNIVGIDQWITAYIQQVLSLCQDSDIPEVLDACLTLSYQADITRCTLQSLLEKFDRYIPSDVLQKIVNVCICSLSQVTTLLNEDAYIIIKILMKTVCVMYNDAASYNINSVSISEMLINCLSLKLSSLCEAAFLPVVAGLLVVSRHMSLSSATDISTLAELVEKYSRADKFDEDIRLSAAKALKFLGKSLKMQIQNLQCVDSCMLDSFVKETSERVLQTVIELLQDEDCDIREEAAMFVSVNMASDGREQLNPNSCLHHLLTPQFLCNFLPSKAAVVLFLCKSLSSSRGSLDELPNFEVSNPFDHGSQNVYAESVKTINIMWKCCQLAVNEIENDAKHVIWSVAGNGLDEVAAIVSLLERKCPSKVLQLRQYLHTSETYFLVKKSYILLQLFSRICSNEDNLIDIKQLINKMQYFIQNMIIFF